MRTPKVPWPPFSLPSNTSHRRTTPPSQPSMILDRNGSILLTV
jgi:hypothetical protein